MSQVLPQLRLRQVCSGLALLLLAYTAVSHWLATQVLTKGQIEDEEELETLARQQR